MVTLFRWFSLVRVDVYWVGTIRSKIRVSWAFYAATKYYYSSSISIKARDIEISPDKCFLGEKRHGKLFLLGVHLSDATHLNKIRQILSSWNTFKLSSIQPLIQTHPLQSDHKSPSPSIAPRSSTQATSHRPRPSSTSTKIKLFRSSKHFSNRTSRLFLNFPKTARHVVFAFW